ncbi:MAG: hypothetical protein AAF389_00850 [Gemmatimonadota bacterium]
MRLFPQSLVIGVVATGVLLGAGIAPASAQEDFRSSDRDRPTRVEDAHPIKFREWEIEAGARGTLREGAERGVHGVLELKTGLFPNAQVGVEVETGWSRAAPGTASASGLESFGAHVLYGFNRETPSRPAVSLRIDVAGPGAGSLGNEDAQFGVLGIVTRSVGRLRVHLNGGLTTASATDGGDFWRTGIGGDYPIGLFSRVILFDVFAEIPRGGGDTRLWVDAGTRVQLSNWTVLDFGVATRVDAWQDGSANVEVVFGLSRVFGISPGVDPYPNPSIR